MKEWREDIESRISNRLLDREFANVSDVLGSDWGAHFPPPRDAAHYREMVMSAIAARYPSYWDRNKTDTTA